MERLANEARLLMVIYVENLTHNRAGIFRGMVAKCDWHCRKLAAATAVTFKIPARHQCGASTRRGHTVDGVFPVTPASLARTLAISTAAHHWPAQSRKAHCRQTRNRVCQPSIDDHRRPLDAAC